MKTTEAKTNISNESKTKSVFKPTIEESFFKGNQSGFFNGFPVQAKLKVGASDDFYEREADAMADKVMPIPEPQVQRSYNTCLGKKRKDELNRKPLADTISRASAVSGNIGWNVSPGVESAIRSSAGGGQYLPATTRSIMETRFGTDFSRVNIHTGSRAQQLNTQLGARAFTYGNDIFFNRGEYNPSSREGKYLLAHELTHVVQQSGIVQPMIQRRSNFCVPYGTTAEALNVKWWLLNTYMRAEGIPTFGTEVRDLYNSYLHRKRGDSLSPRIFNNNSSYIHNSFKEDGLIKDDMDEVLDLVGSRLNRMPGGLSFLRPGQKRYMSLSNFLSTREMENRPINFNNPFSVSGHIAGGIGSSDAGPDYRKITYANVAITKIVLFPRSLGYYLVELRPHYEVFDTIDFCPGDPGSPLEQIITEPMSRLEASNEAYDQPFKVIFSPRPRSKRFWF